MKILLILFAVASCSFGVKTNNKAVSNFKIDKYLGKWYEIARYDHSFEKGCKDVSANYSKRDDGKIKVVNRCIKNGKEKVANAVAKFEGDENVAHLKVSFFWPFYGNYKVIYLDEKYQYAIIDGGTYDYFWILSRKKKIAPSVLNDLIRKAQNFGYDLNKMIILQ
jgi:apolipoprotein D and lipocalin family protein